MTSCRLAFFDIDGTLLGPDGRYSERLRRALLSARRNGIKTAVASGRPLYAAQYLIDELELADAGLFCTGALLYDPTERQVLASHVLDKALVERLLNAAASCDLYTEYCTAHHYYIQKPHPISTEHSRHLRLAPDIRDLWQMAEQEPALKLLFAVDNRADQQKLLMLERQFPEVEFAYARLAKAPDWLFASVISRQADKSTGFEQLLQYHGVSADEVISFGDAQSDMCFLSLAGTGVAMGNASDEVKAIADRVTAPVWEDGVAQVIEELLP